MIGMRSILFNIVYYTTTLIIGIVIIPSLLLPDRLYWPFIRLYFAYVSFLERTILGLGYQVIGKDHIPAHPYIIAAKHQSAYETLKLPLLFSRPVVILKRELLMIPFWGWYAQKAGMIGINRKNARRAMAQMITGVQKAIQKGETVVIFPQGTRVALSDTPDQKPYKRGIYELYAQTGVPVVPMAVNSGLFWPRQAFWKHGGTVTFSFLPAIEPGLSMADFMARLETDLESESTRLCLSGTPSSQGHTPDTGRKRGSWILKGILMSFILLAAYVNIWFYGAQVMQKEAIAAWDTIQKQGLFISNPAPVVSGFPGPYILTWSGQIKNNDLEITIPTLRLTFFPIPYTPMTIDLPNGVMIEGKKLDLPPDQKVVMFQSLMFKIEIPRSLPVQWIKSEVQKLHDQGVAFRLLDMAATGPKLDDKWLRFSGKGHMTYDDLLQPTGSVHIQFDDPAMIEDMLLARIDSPMGQSLVRGIVNSFRKKDDRTGQDILPLDFSFKQGRIYLGPIKVGFFGTIYWPEQPVESKVNGPLYP